MKKHQPILALTVLLLTLSACNKEMINEQPELSGQYITFGMPGIGVETGTRAPVDQFPDGSSFGVLGYCLAQYSPTNTVLNPASGSQTWNNKKQFCRPEVFYNQKIIYDKGVCTYSPLKNWYASTDYNYSFFAYYPYGEGKGFTLNTGATNLGAPKVKFSIPFSGTNVDTPLDETQVPDAMIAQEIDVARNTGQVQLNFLHILTGLNFQINNYNATESGTPGKSVTVHSLKLQGTFYKSIEINFDSGYTFPDETFSGTYTILDKDVTIGGLESVSSIGNKTLLLVSNLTQTGVEDGYLGDVELVIEYTFGDGIRTFKTFTRPENFLPAGGTIYTAQLNFIGDSFVLNFVVDNNQEWETGSDSNITFG